MFDWQHLTKLLAVSLALILALAIVAPQPAHAQFSLGGITGAFNLVNQVANNILSFINNTMRPLLEGVQSAAQALQGFLNQLRNLWEQVVWPLSEINRARNLAANLIAAFRGMFKPGRPRLIYGFLFGAIVCNIVGWYVVAPMKGNPSPAFGLATMWRGLTINGVFGLGTIVFLDLADIYFGKRARVSSDA